VVSVDPENLFVIIGNEIKKRVIKKFELHWNNITGQNEYFSANYQRID
jgi:hypothetical protein